MEVTYVDGFCGVIGAMDEKIALKNIDEGELSADQQRAIRGCSDVLLDIEPLSAAIERNIDKVKSVSVIKDPTLNVKGMEALKKLLGDKLNLEER